MRSEFGTGEIYLRARLGWSEVSPELGQTSLDVADELYFVGEENDLSQVLRNDWPYAVEKDVE